MAAQVAVADAASGSLDHVVTRVCFHQGMLRGSSCTDAQAWAREAESHATGSCLSQARHDAINTPVLSLKTGYCSVCCSAGEYTPALRLSAGIATPCWHCQPLRLSGDGPGRCQALSCESEGQGQRVSTVSRIYIPFIPCHTGRRTESMQNSPASQASKP